VSVLSSWFTLSVVFMQLRPSDYTSLDPNSWGGEKISHSLRFVIQTRESSRDETS
jgi:hypothetical protein